MSGFDVEVACPACGGRFRAPRIRAGTRERCPVCRSEVVVPGDAAAGEDVPPAAPEEPREPPPADAAGRGAPPALPGQRTGRYCVCVRDDARFNSYEVAKALCDLGPGTVLEAKMQVAGGRGILAHGVLADVAPTMLERLAALEVPAFAVDEGCVPEVERSLPVVRLRSVDARALEFQTDDRGTLHPIPTASVAAGFCAIKQVVKGGASDLRVERADGPAGTVQRAFYVEKRERPKILCTLLTRGRSGYLYEVAFTEEEVWYEYLGPRRQTGERQNLPQAMGDIVAHCAAAFFPRSMRDLAAGDTAGAVQMEDRMDYSRYLHWVRCCVGHLWYGGIEH